MNIKPYEFAEKTAKKIKYLRKLHGYSQEELAKLLYTTQTNYSKYERGVQVINGTLARQLANIYNVSVSYILDDNVKTITITLDQYKKLIEARNAINEIEKAVEKPQTANNYLNQDNTSKEEV